MGKPYDSELEKIKSTYNWAINEPIDELVTFVNKSYNFPLLTVGSGGSFSAASYARLLHEKTGSFSKSVTPLELLSLRSSLRDLSILFLSAGGRNQDILSSFKYASISEPRNLLALCTRKKSPLSKLVHDYSYTKIAEYSIPSGKDGFLATNSLLATFVLLFRAYERFWTGYEKLPTSLSPRNKIFDELEDIKKGINKQTWIVLYSNLSQPCAIDLESKFTESALGNIQLSDYRNFAHGRHYWLADKKNNSAVLCLVNPEDKISSSIIDKIPKEIPIIKIETNYSGPVGTIDLLIKTLFLVGLVGKEKKIDPGKPKVPSFGRKLYNIRIPYDYLKESQYLKLQRREKNSINRKISLNHTNKKDIIYFWKNAYQNFINELEKACFSSIIFDYDGTICDPCERFIGPSSTIIDKICELLDFGIYIGIATGRGKSVRKDLQKKMEKKYWKKIIIGYYNCSDIAFLYDNDSPKKDILQNEILNNINEELNTNGLFKIMIKTKLRANQITIFPNETYNWREIREQIIDFMNINYDNKFKLVESSHSIDILPRSVSKLNLNSYMRENILKDHSAQILCIGDRGCWPGNDYELLRTKYSLSVDTVSSDPYSCWNISNAGFRGVQATLEYLNYTYIAGGKLKIKIGKKK